MTTDESAVDGYELSAELRTRLLAPVPAAAARWVERAVGAPVQHQRALLGGTSSAIHLLRTAAAPPRDRVVLRRYVLDWVVNEPAVPANEARPFDCSPPPPTCRHPSCWPAIPAAPSSGCR